MQQLEKGNNKVMNAWAFYDWANSVYSLVISSSIFPFLNPDAIPRMCGPSLQCSDCLAESGFDVCFTKNDISLCPFFTVRFTFKCFPDVFPN